MRTYELWKDGEGNILPLHECIMEKYFDNAGFGCCANRLAAIAEDPYGCRWPSRAWISQQDIESEMRLRWTEEPELEQAFGIEACIQADQRMLQNAY